MKSLKSPNTLKWLNWQIYIEYCITGQSTRQARDCGVMQNKLRIIIGFTLSMLLVGCSALDEKEYVSCGDKFKEYKVILKWNQPNEEHTYNVVVPEGFLPLHKVCGHWKDEEGKYQGVSVLSRDPITLVLHLPITDHSWILKAVNVTDYGFTGTFFQEIWGGLIDAGTFELEQI